tara:strand:- start:403 stop:648 length:246 start_codon:yes stop_codon:yes gene_type:complete
MKIKWNFNSQMTRLREGDLVTFDNRESKVVRVTPTAAYISLPRQVHEFETRFGDQVKFVAPAKTVAISANSEIPVLNRRVA